MGPLRPLNVGAGSHLLRWRTRLGRTTEVRHLYLLSVALASKSYRYVKLYQAGEFPRRPPLLWVFAFSPDDHVRVAVNVQAVPGGWAYAEGTATSPPAATASRPPTRSTRSSGTACSRPPGDAPGGIP